MALDGRGSWTRNDEPGQGRAPAAGLLCTGGDASGVVCSDSDSGTDAAPAAAPDGVLISAECRLSVTDRYRCGLVLWHRHFSNLQPNAKRAPLVVESVRKVRLG